MAAVRLDVQYIGEGAYQVFVVNDGYACDFIEIVLALPQRQGKATVHFIADWKILTPFTDGARIFIGNIRPESRQPRLMYLIDTKLRKPTRLVESLQAQEPAVSRLPRTVGSVHQVLTTRRAEQMILRQYIDQIRINLKQRYLYLRRQYVDLIARDTPLAGLQELWTGNPQARQLIGELRAIQAFEKPYNEGVLPKTFKDSAQARYYEWFIKDWELTPPTGVSPARQLDIEKVANT